MKQLLKKGYLKDWSSYRSIGIHNFLYDYLNPKEVLAFFYTTKSTSIIFNHQYDFQKKDHCTRNTLSHSKTLLKSGEHISVMFLDLSNEFDIVDHELLLEYMYVVGVRGVMLNWFRT